MITKILVYTLLRAIILTVIYSSVIAEALEPDPCCEDCCQPIVFVIGFTGKASDWNDYVKRFKRECSLNCADDRVIKVVEAHDNTDTDEVVSGMEQSFQRISRNR